MNNIEVNLDPENINSLVELLEFRAKVQPNDPAYTFLVDDNQNDRISYQELANKAKLIAAHLQNQTKPGDRALLLCPPGLDFIAAFWGCLYADVIATPVYPPSNIALVDKLQKIITNCEPSVVLSNSVIINELAPLKKLKIASLVSTDTTPSAPMKSSSWNLENIPFLIVDNLSVAESHQWKGSTTTSKDIAFVQYTSGSTEDPKGVILTHGNLLANLKKIHHGFGNSQDDHGLLWLPPYHDMGLIGGILQPLFAGFPCTLFSPLRFLINPYLWLKTLSDNTATVSGGPNFAYDYCTKRITEKQKKHLDLSSWRVAFNGSEPINYSTLHEFYEAFKQCGFRKEAFLLCYGLAEATLYVSGTPHNQVFKTLSISKNKLKKNLIARSDNPDDLKQLVSSGVANDEIKIVNPKNKKACPTDAIGEIWVSNDSVTKGYWNQPEKNLTLIGATIQGDDQEKKYLRTGDLGFIYQSELYVTGRIKDLIIVHGHNYYPHDIESTVIRTNKTIRSGSCVAFSVEVNKEEKLVILCEMHASNAPDFGTLADTISKHVIHDHELPIYSLLFIPPKTLPKTTSGKLKRSLIKQQYIDSALPVLFSWQTSGKEKISGFVAPKTDLEIRVCAIISELLDKQPIGLSDTFFSLGCDSLIAAQLLSAFTEHFGVDLDMSVLFDNPQISTLVSLISKLQVESPQSVAGAQFIAAQSRTGIIPLSTAQKRIWFLHQLRLESPSYNLFLNIDMHGKLKLESLERAVQILVSRHETLRTRFSDIGGEPHQIILPEVTTQIHIIDLQHMSLEDRDLEMNTIINTESSQVFDLSNGPLFHIVLIRIADDEHNMLITLNHIIADGWSLGILFDELSLIYNALINKKEPTANKSVLDYADFALWEESHKNEREHLSSLAYWKEKLQGANPILRLKTDKPIPEKPSFEEKVVEATLPVDTSKKLEKLAHEQKSSLFMVLLAAYQLFLYRYTGDKNNVIGSPIANRTNPQLQRLPPATECSKN